MPEANAMQFPSMQIINNPGHMPGPTPKLRLLNRPCETLRSRHSLSTNPQEDVYSIPNIQELLGHKEISTTMIYTHVLNKVGHSVRSHMDAL